jgi:hypothetical protein
MLVAYSVSNLVFAAQPSAPNPPRKVRAIAVTTSTIEIFWKPPVSSSKIISYVIRRNGVTVASMPSSAESYLDTNVQHSRFYEYSVASMDETGALSAQSNIARVNSPRQNEQRDTSPPSPPEALTAEVEPGVVLLDWYDADDDTDISAYLILRDNKRIDLVDVGILSWRDETVRPNKKYDYQVVTIDTSGNRSKPASVSVRSSVSTKIAEQNAVESQIETPAQVSANLSATSYSSNLRRYPYLTDLVENYATINWATDNSNTVGSVSYGRVGVESCTANTVSATKNTIYVNTVTTFQWKAQLTLLPNTQYCYRVFLGPNNAIDLLGSDPSPTFWTQIPPGDNTPFSFIVLGDWGDVSNAGAEQAILMQSIAQSGARFALTIGDNAQPNGSQTNYGDLVQSGPGISGIFGPQQWALPGRSMAIFPAIGNHGYSNTDTNHTHIVNWPQDRAVQTSNGRYWRELYSGIDNTTPKQYPSVWYAFNAGNFRFYVIEAAWADTNIGTASSPYQVDYDYRWTTNSAEYQWLANDLAANASKPKFAFFHYPLYADNNSQSSNTFLQGANSLEGLLFNSGTILAFAGHAHFYQRSLANGNTIYTTGATGVKLVPIDVPCSNQNLYGLGWSNSKNKGYACGAATVPTTKLQVHHYLLVHVNGDTLTISPINALGQIFDQQTYNVAGGSSPSPTPTSTPDAPTPTPTSTPDAPTPTPTSTPNVPTPTPTSTPDVLTPTPTSTPSIVPVFQDGFETGNMSAWTSSAGLTVQSSVVQNGNFAAQGNTTNGNTYAKKTLTATYSDAYSRIYFNVLSQSSQLNLLRYRTANDASLAYLFVNTSGKLALRNDVSGTTLTSATSVTSGWHSLEFHATINGTSSVTEVWLDGVKINDLSVTMNLGTTPVGRFQIGEVQSGRTYNVVIDSAVFDIQRIFP